MAVGGTAPEMVAERRLESSLTDDETTGAGSVSALAPEILAIEDGPIVRISCLAFV